MLAKFLGTKGEWLDAAVEIDDRVFYVMDEFAGDTLSPGDMVNLDVVPGVYDEREEWKSVFSGNPEARKSLEHQSGWRYRAYGVITSVRPVMVDVGLFEIEAPIHSSDDRLVGAPVAFTIEMLDACPASA